MKIEGKYVYADNGKYLTQVECEDNERMFCIEMRTGKFFNLDSWTEWTTEEKEQWEQEHRPEPETNENA